MTLRTGPAWTDTETAAQLMRDHRDLETKINSLISRLGQHPVIEDNNVDVAKITSVLVDDENQRQTQSQWVAFDDSTEARLVANFSILPRLPRNANALGGFAFPTDDLVWQIKTTGGTYAQMMRVQGQVWLGTTTAAILVGGEGKADIINAEGATISVTIHDFFGEEVGVGVNVVGCYAPDGRNYCIAAACEHEADPGITNPTPN